MADWLVICDGSISGLLGLAFASERPGSRFWTPQGQEAWRDRAAAASRAAELYALAPFDADTQVPLSDLRGDRWLNATLLAAAAAAGDRGLNVLWPITAPPAADALAVVSLNLNRAVLVGQLASLAGPPVEVQTPFADYSEEQLADLVLDMDLPIWTCWWFDPHAVEASLQPLAEAERERWTGLLQGAGWRGPLPDGRATPAPAEH
jgi:hypothetical protein